jgi:hypothetical protein
MAITHCQTWTDGRQAATLKSISRFRLDQATEAKSPRLPLVQEAEVPRYFFHYRTDDELIRDEAGSDHPDLEAAEHRAAELGKAIIDRLAGQEGGEVGLPRTIEITDAAGEELLYVVFWAGPKIGEGGSPVAPATVH